MGDNNVITPTREVKVNKPFLLYYLIQACGDLFIDSLQLYITLQTIININETDNIILSFQC